MRSNTQTKTKTIWTSIILITLISNLALAQNQRIILLRHSTGGNVFTQGKVAQWFDTYNKTNNTAYEISMRTYPDKPYPWNNYPYDYWNLWINTEGPADPCQPGIDTLEHLAKNYDVIAFKHCFPGALVLSDSNSPSVSSSVRTLANYKLQYRALREKFDTLPDTTFVVWTLAPMHRLGTTPEQAARARAFVDWVRNEWLTEDHKEHPNIFFFDFWKYMAEERNTPSHVDGRINTLRYEYERNHTSDDSHPNELANQTVGPIFAQRLIDIIESITPKPITP